ncbi:MAG TPA: glycosyltransferase [Polyangiaceae bacterium]|nr:glycosyltransferase [Polyangiaceae bacterium]
MPDPATQATPALSPLEQAPRGPLCIPALAARPAPIRLSLVIPTFNEAKNVGELVRRLTALLDEPLAGAYELIVVDDDSPDRTWEVAQGLTGTYPNLRVLRRQGERGLSSAVIRGWQLARGEVLGVIDADLQHPPEVTVGIWREMDRGADLVVASRHIDGGGVSDWSMARRVLSRGAQLLGLLVLPNVVGRISDPMSGYFMVRRSAIQGVELHPLGYKILIEVLGRGTIRWIGEVPYVFRERLEGESKVTWKLYVEYLRHLLRLRLSRLPIERFVRFALVGSTGVVVDMGLLFLLSDPHTLAWGLTRSKVLAAEAAIVNNFVWNDVWTFRDVASTQPDARSRFARFLKFQTVCLSGLVLNTILLNLQFNWLGINRYLANAIAIGIVTAWNFWLNLKLSWRATVVNQGAPSPTGAGDEAPAAGSKASVAAADALGALTAAGADRIDPADATSDGVAVRRRTQTDQSAS